MSAVFFFSVLGALFSHPVAPVPVWRMTPEQARAVAVAGPGHRKQDTKANNAGSVRQEEMGTGDRAAGQAPAPGVWASMTDPVQEGRGPGPRGGNTEGEGAAA